MLISPLVGITQAWIFYMVVYSLHLYVGRDVEQVFIVLKAPENQKTCKLPKFNQNSLNREYMQRLLSTSVESRPSLKP